MYNLKHISKVESYKFTGYLVRFYRFGETSSTSFSVSEYGNMESALKAAVNFRDKVESQIPEKEKKYPFKLKQNGLPKGVTKSVALGGSGNKIPCYVVSFRGHTKRFYFETGDNSELEAREKAIAYHKKVHENNP